LVWEAPEGKRYMLIKSWLEKQHLLIGKKQFCPRHQSWNLILKTIIFRCTNSW
jgi:hypothetical protein